MFAASMFVITSRFASPEKVESPTISPLQEQGWSAVRSMVPRKDAHRVMDELWTIGARGILVTDIHACRL